MIIIAKIWFVVHVYFCSNKQFYDMNDKERFIGILRRTERKGVDIVLEQLEELGFFDAPASTAFHLNVPGGLVKHSLNVYDEAVAIADVQKRLRPEQEGGLQGDSIAIAALLHDVCKAEIYRSARKSRKNSDDRWEYYSGYDVDYSSFPMGHGEKSVIRLLLWGLEMTEDEMLAIRWHMGAFDLPFQSPEAKSNLNAAKSKCPLIAVIGAADGLATSVLETDLP